MAGVEGTNRHRAERATQKPPEGKGGRGGSRAALRGFHQPGHGIGDGDLKHPHQPDHHREHAPDAANPGGGNDGHGNGEHEKHPGGQLQHTVIAKPENQPRIHEIADQRSGGDRGKYDAEPARAHAVMLDKDKRAGGEHAEKHEGKTEG